MTQVSRETTNAARTEACNDGHSTVGNWQVVDLLGEGPWSRVYRAKPLDSDAKAHSDYAIKVARQDAGPDTDTAIRLIRREASVGRTVAHPHLTCVLSSHVGQSPYYVVMPCLDGVTLEAALDEAGMVLTPHALWIARQTAQAIRALHDHGWLHSDIKPANIFVSQDGHVTLLDLGLARQIGHIECAGDGPLAGTMAYAAPEAFSSVDEIGPQSDIYSLGVTLFRMLTGTLPFATHAAADLAAAHLRGTPPDPRRFNPLLPSRVVRLLKRMLTKQPSRRPCAAELVAWLADLEIDTLDDRFAA